MPSIAASPAWYSRATECPRRSPSPPIDVADSAIACAICAASSRQQSRRCDRGGEDCAVTAVEAALPEAWRDRFADPSGRLVAAHDRRQHRFAAGAVALGDRQ